MAEARSPLRVLWITPRLLSGTPDGARHATIALIRHLSRRDVSIDLLSMPMGQVIGLAADQVDFGLNHAVGVSRNPSWMASPPSLFSPWTFRTFINRGVRDGVRAELHRFFTSIQPGEMAFIVFDGLHTAAPLTAIDWEMVIQKSQGTVYRAHNFETELWQQCIGKTSWPWMKLFFWFQTALVRAFESQLARRVSTVATVSEQDAEQFSALTPAARVNVSRIGMDFPDEKDVVPVPGTSGFELLFIGRLDWLPNREGLKWFLERVWGKVTERRPGVTLKIAGMGEASWLEPYRGTPGLHILGEVSRIEPLYKESTLALAPLFQGSGTRVKIIEASRYGRATLSTALGAQGGGLEAGISYFRAETESEWVDALTTLSVDQCRAVGIQAFRVGRSRFDASIIGEQFEQMLQKLVV